MNESDLSSAVRAAKKRKTAKSRSERIVFVAVFVLFFLYAATLVYPFLYCLNASLINGGRAFMRDPVGMAKPPKFVNYLSAFSQLDVNGSNFFAMTLNSVWFSFGGTILQMLFTSMAAYVVCKYRFRGREFIYSMVIVIMMIPVYGSLPAQYRLYSRLGMVDSPLILLAYCSGFGMNFLVIYSFFKGISWSYAEAAFIDGAGNSKVFFSIMLPMALPAVSAMGIMGFVGMWNDYLTPILYMSRTFPTLASGIYLYEKKIAYTANQPVYFAGVILSLLPVMAIFLAFQNKIMSNIYAGGLKG